MKTGRQTYTFKNARDILYFYVGLQLEVNRITTKSVVNDRFSSEEGVHSVRLLWRANAIAAAEVLLSRYFLPDNIEVNLIHIEGTNTDTSEAAVGAAVFAAVFDALDEPLSPEDVELLKVFIREEQQYARSWEKVPNYGSIDLSKPKLHVPDPGLCEVCECFVKRVHFYADEEQLLSKVDLLGAIEAFQNFPWEMQLKEKSSRQMTSSSPTVKFKREGESALSIWMNKNNHFEVYYENRYEQAYGIVPLDLTLNAEVTSVDELFAQSFARPCFPFKNNWELEGTSAEDLIGLFFEGTIEKELLLGPKYELDFPKLKGEPENLRFEYSGAEPYAFLGSVSLGLFTLMVFLVIMLAERAVYWVLLSFTILTSLIGLPKALVKRSHWRASKNSFLVLDPVKKTFEFTKSGKTKCFSRTDIELCKIFYSASYMDNFMRLYLNDGSQVVISSLLVNAFELVEEMDLHYVMKKVREPIIKDSKVLR